MKGWNAVATGKHEQLTIEQKQVVKGLFAKLDAHRREFTTAMYVLSGRAETGDHADRIEAAKRSWFLCEDYLVKVRKLTGLINGMTDGKAE